MGKETSRSELIEHALIITTTTTVIMLAVVFQKCNFVVVVVVKPFWILSFNLRLVTEL